MIAFKQLKATEMAVKASAVLIFLLLLHDLLCISAKGGEHSFVREAKKRGKWKESRYNYIIVGEGTAGCSLAATLSHNMSVVLLERGGSPFSNENITEIENFHTNLLDYEAPHSPTQEVISEDGVITVRARVLGRGTCLSAGFYSRASSSEMRGMGLEASLVEQSYRWVEIIVAHRPPANEWQDAVAEGLVEAGVSSYNGFTYDHIPGTKFGGTIFNQTGYRFTAADILVQRANPRKLTVLLYATVQRLLFDSKGKMRPQAYEVVFRDKDGAKHRVFLKKHTSEVIISAGALGSPQLLMLSRIGHVEELKSMGIQVIMDQPTVGKGMVDNPMNSISVTSTIPINLSLI